MDVLCNQSIICSLLHKILLYFLANIKLELLKQTSQKDEGASCYCSASHTDNYCSTDEHDPAQVHGTISHPLQPSDSGADLTYQDCHLEYTNHDKLEKMDQDIQESNEDYLSDNTWEKFWAINGERLIWASWIKKYSDYINPNYLDENNDLTMDESHIPKQHSFDQIYDKEQKTLNQKLRDEDDSMRERKFSYDSKVNPYKKGRIDQNSVKIDKHNESNNKDDTWVPVGRRRSCSEHVRMLSPRTLAATDSMTNVTKLTASSYDVNSSHVTSESTPTDDYSVSSTSSDDQSNDQTRIVNIVPDENIEFVAPEETDTEQYWQLLWKKHFGDQYALHYANYIECREAQSKNEPTTTLPVINVQTEVKIEEKVADIECEISEGNSQEMPSVIEVQTQVEDMKIEEKVTRPRKRNKKTSNRIIGSVGMLLQNLIKEERKKNELVQEENVDGAEGNNDKSESAPVSADVTDGTAVSSNNMQSISNSSFSPYSYNDGDDEPPEQKSVSLKRR